MANAQQVPKDARFELAVIESPSSVRARFARTMAVVSKEGFPMTCPALPGTVSCKRLPDGILWVVPPFPIRREVYPTGGVRISTDVGETYAPLFAWAPLSLTIGGRDSLAAWSSHSADGTPSSCVEFSCAFIVRGFVGEGTYIREDDVMILPGTEPVSEALSKLEVLVECRTGRLQEAIGVPRNCRQIAVLERDTVWFSVLVGLYPRQTGPMQQGAAARRISDVRFIFAGPQPNTDTVISRSEQLLSRSPLSLITHVRPRRVSGYASFRLSTILPKPPSYREMVQIEVYADSVEKTLELLGDIVLSVNPQNTDRPEDWHMPKPSQQKAYVDTLRLRMRQMISEICPAAQWRDSQRLTCK